MSDINKIISSLFKSRWTANLADAPIEDQRKQLYKNLIDQTNGFWSGHTAYHILVDGGFIVDSKMLKNRDGTRKGKKLTVLGLIQTQTDEKITTCINNMMANYRKEGIL